MRLGELVAVSRSVAETNGRLDKVDRLASLLKRISPEAIEIEIATSFLSGAPRQGRIGLGGGALHASRGLPPAENPILDLREVDDAFGAIQSAAGPGSSELRAGRLRDLLRRATRDEQDEEDREQPSHRHGTASAVPRFTARSSWIQ
jgi:hypothetical protein